MSDTPNERSTVGRASALPEADWYLQYLVELVTGTDASFPITLFVGGTIVSGYLVSGHRFFDDLNTEMLNLFSGDLETNKKHADFLTQQAREMYVQRDADSKDQAVVGGSPPAFIHLTDARVFSPGKPPLPSDRGVSWRGRLTSVDAFHWGALGVAASEAG